MHNSELRHDYFVMATRTAFDCVIMVGFGMVPGLASSADGLIGHALSMTTVVAHAAVFLHIVLFAALRSAIDVLPPAICSLVAFVATAVSVDAAAIADSSNAGLSLFEVLCTALVGTLSVTAASRFADAARTAWLWASACRERDPEVRGRLLRNVPETRADDSPMRLRPAPSALSLAIDGLNSNGQPGKEEDSVTPASGSKRGGRASIALVTIDDQHGSGVGAASDPPGKGEPPKDGFAKLIALLDAELESSTCKGVARSRLQEVQTFLETAGLLMDDLPAEQVEEEGEDSDEAATSASEKSDPPEAMNQTTRQWIRDTAQRQQSFAHMRVGSFAAHRHPSNPTNAAKESLRSVAAPLGLFDVRDGELVTVQESSAAADGRRHSGFGRRRSSNNSMRSMSSISTGESVSVSSDALRRLEAATAWDFDIFQLANETQQEPLAPMLAELFTRFRCFDCQNIDKAVFWRWATMLEATYCYDPRRPNPYHSAVHAADVTQATSHFLSIPRISCVLGQLDAFVALFSAACHDYRHPGVSNKFLMTTKHELATMYNDESVLENYHIAHAFALVRDQRFDVLGNLDDATRSKVREHAIGLVQATDLSIGGQIIAQFKSCNLVTQDVGAGAGARTKRSREITAVTDEDKHLLLRMVIKCADVSHPARPLAVHQRWTDVITTEFYEMGDMERRMGIAVSPLCDRFKHDLPNSQLGFIKFVVRPSFKALSEFAGVKTWMNRMDENTAFWTAAQARAKQAAAGAVGAEEGAARGRGDSFSAEQEAMATFNEQEHLDYHAARQTAAEGGGVYAATRELVVGGIYSIVDLLEADVPPSGSELAASVQAAALHTQDRSPPPTLQMTEGGSPSRRQTRSLTTDLHVGTGAAEAPGSSRSAADAPTTPSAAPASPVVGSPTLLPPPGQPLAPGATGIDDE